MNPLRILVYFYSWMYHIYEEIKWESEQQYIDIRGRRFRE